MSDISKVDKNFEVGKSINQPGIAFHDPLKPPFVISGLTYGDGRFFRMDPAVAEKVNDGVSVLNYHTAGGRIRFKTDSPYVAIAVQYNGVSKMPHFAFCGSIGFDLYADNIYRGTFMPSVDITDSLESIVMLGDGGMREITVNFPLYSEVKKVYVGLDENARIEAPTPYESELPIVYYGSSITQGGCASRPGTCYQAYISRAFNADYLNLGFSGSARAEDAIIDYIKALDMRMFVYDYDYNAPTTEHLIETHEKMFRAIREAHPTLPIVIMSRPKHIRTADEERRMQIITDTYRHARDGGDTNVYLLNGDDLTALCKENGTVDNCHPTDFGFAAMADALIALIRREKLL